MTKRRSTPRKATPRPKRRVGAPVLDARVADLRALAHPLRLRIAESFAEAPRTTKQVAELLGEPPTRLYHHVAALERAGFLVLKETRQNRGATEKWYQTVAPRFSDGVNTSEMLATSATRDARNAKRALIAAVLDQARGELVAALSESAEQPATLTRLIVAASSSTVTEIRRRLSDAIATIQRELGDSDHASDENCERWAVTLAFAPVWPQPKRTKKAAD